MFKTIREENTVTVHPVDDVQIIAKTYWNACQLWLERMIERLEQAEESLVVEETWQKSPCHMSMGINRLTGCDMKQD